MIELDNTTLVQEARSGDKVAFGELVNRYQDYVYQLVYKRTFNCEDAKDLAQETFCKAFIHLKQIREPNKFQGWLKQIAMNLATDWLRDGSYEREVREPLAGREQSSHDEESVQNFEREQLLAELREAMNSLSEINREAVIMHYLEGYSYREISTELGIPESTVRGRLQEARRNLRIDLSAAAASLNLDQLRAPEGFVQNVMESIRHLSPVPKGNVGRILPGILVGFLVLAIVSFFVVRHQPKGASKQTEEPPQTNNPPLLFDDFEDGDYIANPTWRFLRLVEEEDLRKYQIMETDGSLAFKLAEFSEQSASAWTPVLAQDFIFSVDVKATRHDAIWSVSAHTHIVDEKEIGFQAFRLQYQRWKFLLIGGPGGPDEVLLDTNAKLGILEDGRFHLYEIIRQNGRIQVKRDSEIILSGEDLVAGESINAILLSGFGDMQGTDVGAYFDNVMVRAIE